MNNRLDDGILKHVQSPCFQHSGDGHLLHLGNAIEGQHTNRVVHHQFVGIGDAPTPDQSQRRTADLQWGTRVGQGFVGEHIHGRVSLVYKVRGDCGVFVNVQEAAVENHRAVVQRGVGGTDFQRPGKGQVVVNPGSAPQTHQFQRLTGLDGDGFRHRQLLASGNINAGRPGMQQRFNEDIFSDCQLPLREGTRHRNLRHLGDTVERQHTAGVIQNQIVLIPQNSPSGDRQSVRANLQSIPRIHQCLARKDADGRVGLLGEVGGDCRVVLHLQCPTIQKQGAVIQDVARPRKLQCSGKRQCVVQAQGTSVSDQFQGPSGRHLKGSVHAQTNIIGEVKLGRPSKRKPFDARVVVHGQLARGQHFRNRHTLQLGHAAQIQDTGRIAQTEVVRINKRPASGKGQLI